MLEKLRDIKLEIKWAWQRVFRGYDDRIYWGFDYHLTKIIPAIKKFANDYLNNQTHHQVGNQRESIYKKTLELIDDYEKNHEKDWSDNDNSHSRLFKYFGEYSQWFWD